MQKLVMLYPLKCNGMEKAKQINLEPTTVHCMDRLQGRRGGSEPATSYPCRRNCPTGNEKSSRHTVPAAAGTKGVLPDPRLSIPARAPCSAGDGVKHLPLHKGCDGWCKPGLCPSPWGSRQPSKLESSGPPQNTGPHSSGYKPSLHPYAAFQTQPENETSVPRLPQARAELLSTISFLSGPGLTGCFHLRFAI